MTALKATLWLGILTVLVQGFLISEFDLLRLESFFLACLVWSVVGFTLLTFAVGLMISILMHLCNVRAEWFLFSLSGQFASAGNSLVLFVLSKRAEELYLVSFSFSCLFFISLFFWYFVIGKGTYSMLWRMQHDSDKYDFDNRRFHVSIKTSNQLGPESFWATPVARKVDVGLAIILILLLAFAKYSHSFLADHIVAPMIIGFVVAVAHMLLLMVPRAALYLAKEANSGRPLYLAP